MEEYWIIALSREKPFGGHRQYVKRIEAESEEDAWEIARVWFEQNHAGGHQWAKYEYFVTKKIPKICVSLPVRKEC